MRVVNEGVPSSPKRIKTTPPQWAKTGMLASVLSRTRARYARPIIGLGIITIIGAILYFAWPLLILIAIGGIGYLIYKKSTERARNTV